MGDDVGSCPTCPTMFRINPDNTLVQFTRLGECRRCRGNHTKELDRNRMCRDCKLGESHPLDYICQKCGNTQTIFHPMWRYQVTPNQFTTDTWACQQCDDYTRWKIVEEQVEVIPRS